MTSATAAEALRRLNLFVGVWHTEGEVKSSAPAPPARFGATDTYEWLPGGHFLLHRFDADMPDGRVQGIEVIGYSREVDSYLMHSFDSAGHASLMEGRVEGDTWTFVGEGVRFTGRFRDDGKVLAGRWEMRPGEGRPWEPWMDVTLRRAA